MQLRRRHRRRRRRRPALRRDRRPARPARSCSSTTPRRSPRRSASRAAAAATSPTSTPARRTSTLGESATSAARRWRATRRATSSRWSSATASPGTRSTRASSSATARARRSSPCCSPNATPAACSAGSRAASRAVRVGAAGFELDTERGPVAATRLVVATGGLSIPKIGASDWGYASPASSATASSRRGRRWCRFVCDGADWQPFAALAGVSLPVAVEAGAGAGRAEFDDDLLFTHRGLSGPAALQISTYWRPGERVVIDLAPGADLGRALLDAKQTRRGVAAVLGDVLPRRLVDRLARGEPRRQATGRWPTSATATSPRWPPAVQRWTPMPDGHRGLPQGRGHGRRRRHPRARLAQPARAGACRACISSARWST